MDPKDAPDAELMELLRRGDGEALAVLVRRHERALVNFFRRLGADGDGAEDCAQETFLRLFRARDTYRPVTGFGAFLYTVARHAWIDWRRKAGRAQAPRRVEGGDPVGGDRHEITAGRHPLAEERMTVDPMDGIEDRMDLRAAIEELPEHLRWVMVLSVNQGLGYAEIAEVLGIPVGTVKSRMFHAVRRLREALHGREPR